MIHPTIHLNGTGKQELIDRWNDAYAALYDARTALQHASPNARDYYPQGTEAWPIADLEHVLRIQKINEVMAEIDALREQVAFPQDL